MQDSKAAFDNISNNLAIIRHDIDQHQAVGDYSLNKWGEGFFMHIFNFVYGYELEDANFKTANAPCIDLVDTNPNRKLAYQITTTRTTEKIRNTLKALKKPEYQDYEIRMFYLLDKANPSGSTITKIKDEFGIDNISKLLFDYTDLLKAIKNIKPSKKIIELNDDYFKKKDSELIKKVEELAAELGVTKNAFQNFFRILGEKNIPSYDYDHELRKIAEHYHNNLKELANFQSEDPEVKALLNQAEQVLEQGDFDKTEDLINQAKTKDLLAAKKLQENANKRFLSAAESAARNAELKLTQIKYVEAARYFQEAADIVPEVFAEKLAFYLNQAGGAFYFTGKYEETESLYKRALAISEENLGELHPFVATCLNNLAELYKTQGKYQEADPLYQRALEIVKKAFGKKSSSVATALSNLADLYRIYEYFQVAEHFLLRALAIYKESIGESHLLVAGSLSILAGIYCTQGKYSKAETLFLRALAINEKILGEKHPDVAIALNNLAGLYLYQRKYTEAESLYLRSLAIRKKC